jgi:undecaprenyl phosphate-alpha-L-ara4FN deformylase
MKMNKKEKTVKNKTISLSIHVDGYLGLTKGVENILKVLDKNNLKASFFVSMGNEASFFETLRLRKKTSSKNSRILISRYGKFDIIKMLFLRRRLGSGHFEILRKIKERGHDVNPHCWSHLKWSKDFENLDIKKEFDKICTSYRACFNKDPKGFVPPMWKFSKQVISEMNFRGFDYISIKNNISNSPGPCLREGLHFIPLSFNYTPEELLNEGYSEKEIIEIYKKELDKKYVNLYFHADFEGIKGLPLFEKILEEISKQRIKTVTYPELTKN